MNGIRCECCGHKVFVAVVVAVTVVMSKENTKIKIILISNTNVSFDVLLKT